MICQNLPVARNFNPKKQVISGISCCGMAVGKLVGAKPALVCGAGFSSFWTFQFGQLSSIRY